MKNTNKTMNNTRLGTAILSILVLSLSWLHTPAHAEPMGISPKGEGVIYQNELGIQTVRKTFSKDTPMKRHNHPNDIVTLTVTNGLAQVLLNGQEAHTLSSGDVLIFDGKYDIEGTFLETTTVVVTLVSKDKTANNHLKPAHHHHHAH